METGEENTATAPQEEVYPPLHLFFETAKIIKLIDGKTGEKGNGRFDATVELSHELINGTGNSFILISESPRKFSVAIFTHNYLQPATLSLAAHTGIEPVRTPCGPPRSQNGNSTPSSSALRAAIDSS